MNYSPPFTITYKILDLVSKITEAATRLEISEYHIVLLRLRKTNRIKTIAGTLEIEGNTLGAQKITAIMEGKRVVGQKRKIEEVKGAVKVYDELESFDYKNINDILKAHKILMGGILKDAGQFRNKDVGVGDNENIVHIAPPAGRVLELMYSLFKWLNNSEAHTLIKSSVFHNELEFIHLFTDGNGRIGRLWQTLILHNWKPIFSNIPIESIVRDTQKQYYEALEKFGNLGDVAPFVEYMLEAVLTVCKEVLSQAPQAQNVTKTVPKNVPLKRLDKILELIKDNKNITIEQLADLCSVSTKTIKRDITKLKEQGKLKRIGSKKSGYWKLEQ